MGLDSSLKSTAEGFADYYHQRESCLQELEEGWIKLNITNKPIENGGELLINISDSGAGFDYDSIMRNSDQSKNNSGRGLALIEDLSTAIIYHNDKNMLDVIYKWE